MTKGKSKIPLLLLIIQGKPFIDLKARGLSGILLGEVMLLIRIRLRLWACWGKECRAAVRAARLISSSKETIQGSGGIQEGYLAPNQVRAVVLCSQAFLLLSIIFSCIICHNLWLVRPINHASEKMRFLTRRLSVSDKQGIIQLASFSKHLVTGFGKLVLFVI